MTSSTPKRPSGMFGLTIVLIGQAISILASSMTGFALSIWVFQQTSSATSLGIMQTAFTLPYLLIIPLAGVQFQEQMLPIRQQVGDLLRQGSTCSHSATAGTCRDILKREAALWTFIDVEGVQPTNNLAEQKIRPGVLWRNSSFGTQSKAGSRFVERILTVATTLKQQKRNLLDYLTRACEAANYGRSSPSILTDGALVLVP